VEVAQMDGWVCEMFWALSLTPTWLLSLSTVLHNQQCKSGIFKPKATDKELQRLRQFLQHLWQKSARPIPLLLPFLQGPLLLLLIYNAFPSFFVHIIFFSSHGSFSHSYTCIVFLTDQLSRQNNGFSLRLPLRVQLLAVTRIWARRWSDDPWLGSGTGRFGPNLVRLRRVWRGGLQDHPGLHCNHWDCEEEENRRVWFPATVPTGVFACVGNLVGSDEPEEREPPEGPAVLKD